MAPYWEIQPTFVSTALSHLGNLWLGFCDSLPPSLPSTKNKWCSLLLALLLGKAFLLLKLTFLDIAIDFSFFSFKRGMSLISLCRRIDAPFWNFDPCSYFKSYITGWGSSRVGVFGKTWPASEYQQNEILKFCGPSLPAPPLNFSLTKTELVKQVFQILKEGKKWIVGRQRETGWREIKIISLNVTFLHQEKSFSPEGRLRRLPWEYSWAKGR